MVRGFAQGSGSNPGSGVIFLLSNKFILINKKKEQKYNQGFNLVVSVEPSVYCEKRNLYVQYKSGLNHLRREIGRSTESDCAIVPGWNRVNGIRWRHSKVGWVNCGKVLSPIIDRKSAKCQFYKWSFRLWPWINN